MSHFITDNALSTSSVTEHTDVIDPSNGTTVETVGGAGLEEVDPAVDAAAAAYRPWSRGTPVERSAILSRFAR